MYISGLPMEGSGIARGIAQFGDLDDIGQFFPDVVSFFSMPLISAAREAMPRMTSPMAGLHPE